MNLRAAAISVVLSASFIPAAGPAEVVKGYTNQAEIDAMGAAGDVIAIEFYPGVKVVSPPAIVDEAGKVVSSKVLLNQDRGKLMIIFDGSGGGRKYALHYGGHGAAARPRAQWDPTPSLLMEVRSKPPGNANSWTAMKGLLTHSEDQVQGMMFVPNVFHACNPFGPSEDFITIYRGEFLIHEEGDYRLFTASSDASFVFIDGELAFWWAGVHGVEAGRKGRHGRIMHLTKGRHSIEYYHCNAEGTPYMCLGWHKKNDKVPRVMSGFVNTPVARVRKPARKSGGPTASFTWLQDQALLFDDTQYILYKFYNRSTGKADAAVWDFGDGVTSSEGDPYHVFTGSPPYRVVLTLKSGEQTDSCWIDVPMLTPMSNATINDPATLREFASVIGTYPFEKLPGPTLVRYLDLLDHLEQPLLLAPICEAIINKNPASAALIGRAKSILVRAYSITDPQKALPLLRTLADSRDAAAAVEAKASLIELYLHKFRDFERALKMADVTAASASPNSVLGRLARVKAGDVYLLQGDIKKAEERYLEAQELAFAGMDRREISVRQGAYAETVSSLLAASRFREARKTLIQWEVDYPISKITGDFILMNSRYWELMGDARKALDGMQCLVRINPLTPYLPRIEYRMANAYRDLGEKDKAEALYKKVIKAYPLNPVASEAQLALNALR